MALVTVAELKTVLNIGDLYPDDVVEQVADTASNVILSMLSRKASSVVEASDLDGSDLTLTTLSDHLFAVGETLTLADWPISALNGLDVDVAEVPTDDTLVVTFAGGVTIPATAVTVYRPYPRLFDTVSKDYYEDVPEVREAALAIAVDVFQSRVAPGGQMEAVDFTPGPYRLGRSLMSRVSGILGRHLDTGTLVG